MEEYKLNWIELKSIGGRDRRKIYRSGIIKYETERMSDRQIAERLCISPTGFSKIRKRYGWVRIYSEVDRSDKGKNRISDIDKKKSRSEYMKEYRKNRPSYKNVRVNLDGKSIVTQEHRLVMMRHLGRRLERGEIIHHIDGNVRNNSIDNLQIFKSNGDHIKFHIDNNNKPD